MPGTAVGLYCAVVERLDLPVSRHALVERESQAPSTIVPGTHAHSWAR